MVIKKILNENLSFSPGSDAEGANGFTDNNKEWLKPAAKKRKLPEPEEEEEESDDDEVMVSRD